MGSQSQKIPCLVGSVDLTSLPLNTLEGFVLSRIDGQANLEMLSDLTSLELPQIVEIIDKLISLGAVAWHRQKLSLPKASDRAPVPEQVRRAAREAAAASAEPEGARSPPAPEAEDRVTSPAASTDPVGEPSEISDDLEIPPERRKRIDDLYMVLELLDHYQVLGVERDAPRREIRSAYFEASKVFHPDTMFRKRLGPYKAKMEAVFRRLTEAYETLGKKRLRAQYDEVLTAQDRARRRLSDAPSESDEPSTGADAAPDESGSGAPTSPEPAAPKADRALTSPSVVVSSQDRSGSSGQAVVKTETASDDVQEEPPRSPKQSQPSPKRSRVAAS